LADFDPSRQSDLIQLLQRCLDVILFFVGHDWLDEPCGVAEPVECPEVPVIPARKHILQIELHVPTGVRVIEIPKNPER
jgi:hypothetical protein